MAFLQEILIADDPSGWRMLVGCILLNRTTRAQVDRVYPILFREYPDPFILEAATSDLHRILEPLGLHHRRARTLERFSDWWVRYYDLLFATEFDRRIVQMKPPGIGEYARDSWVIFKMKQRPDWVVRDHALLEYLDIDSPS